MKPIKIPNEKELLQEIRNNNCREILSCGINMRIAEGSKTKYPARMGEIENFITVQRQRLDDLTDGVRLIDERINEL